MQEIVMRLGVLVFVGFAVWLCVSFCRGFIAAQRHKALAAAPLYVHENPTAVDSTTNEQAVHNLLPARILAFSSTDCRQCHQLQTPALRRVVEARGSAVSVVDIDATVEDKLVQTYHILTVPSTVVLDATGQARAVNYGFANTQLLLTQIDAILAS